MNPQMMIEALKAKIAQGRALGGSAGQASQTLADRGYQLHVQEAQAQGQSPLSLDQYRAQQGPR